MKFKSTIYSFLVCLILFFFFTPNVALAASFSLSGSVKNNSGTAIVGATVDVYSPGTTTDVVSPTTTDSSGNYSFSSVPQGTYDIKVIPPSGSGFSSAIALRQNLANNTVLNFVLTPTGTVTLSGHIYDALGNPVASQGIGLRLNGNQVSNKTTDSAGSYSFQVSPGTYEIDIANNLTNYSFNVPGDYSITANYALNQDTMLDVNLPLKKVSMHVQDSSGNPISGAILQTSTPTISNLNIGGGITNASGNSSYGNNSTGPTTDASGNVILWLFPTNTNKTYSFTAIPPTGSNFSTTTITNKTFTADTSFTITMQQPVTLSGHIFDALGNPLPTQGIDLRLNGNQVAQTTTDASGSYSLSVSPGTYTVELANTATNYALNIPGNYLIQANNYSLTQNTVLNITLPLKKVSMHVQDAVGNPIAGSEIDTNNVSSTGLTIGGGITNASGNSSYGNGGTGPTTDSSGNIILWLLPSNTSTKYTFTAVPPHGSNFVQTSITNTNITNDTSLTITMQQPVTLSGHIYDALGNPVPNQGLDLRLNSNQIVQTTTNASGVYSVNAITGTYQLEVANTSTNYALNIPGDYLVTSSYSLTQNTTLDINLPLKKVSMHVQDSLGNPVSGIVLQTSTPTVSGLNIGGGITNASGNSSYGNNATGPVTDASGNVILWLFPTSTGKSYSFTATPPNGSIYNTFTLNNITVTGDQTELVALQYNHAAPITAANLATLNSDGTYSDPTTVTLSATAASYTVANTYYTIDGGTQQTYSSPFTVSGAGNHTITYWSVDNSGVPEATNTKTFTITEAYNLSGTIYVDANQNGVQDTDEQGYAGATVTLNTGQSTTTDSNGNYTFANLETGSYVDSLTVPDGYIATTTNPVTIPLTAGTTQNFGIAVPTATPTPTVTPTPTDTPTPTPTATPTPTPVPTSQTIGTITVTPSSTHINTTTSASASFTDQDTQETHTATWNWGDGSSQTAGSVTEANGSGTVTGSHTYTSFGTYTVTLMVTDKYGISTQKTTSINVVKQLTALDPATVYISNSLLPLLGTYNLKAEVYKNSNLVTSGTLNGVSPGLSTTAETISFSSFSPVDFPTGTSLAVNLYACNASGILGTGTATLHYNASTVDSKFGATIGLTDTTYHLLTNHVLGTSVGTSAQTTTAQSKCSSGFTSLGTWTVTP